MNEIRPENSTPDNRETSWVQLQKDLRSVLRGLPPASYLVLSPLSNPAHGWVEVVSSDPSTDLTILCRDNFTPEQEDRRRTAGWHRDPEQEWWVQRIVWPAPSRQYHEAAASICAVLMESSDAPTDIHYYAWTDPRHNTPSKQVNFELSLPTLGLFQDSTLS